MDMTIDQQVSLDKALAFLVTADVSAIYVQEFWATTTVRHHSIRFKLNNKKHIVNLEYFKEMLHICPRIPNQSFDELPFEEEILTFLRAIGHSGEIKKITNVSINKLHQPWRSFAAVINKCLSGKSTGYDSLRIFVYQAEHKDAKKSNEMYYPRFTKVIINFFMTKDPSIPMRNKYSAILPVELTNEAIRNFNTYKEYYAIASGAEPPKTKASVRKTQSNDDDQDDNDDDQDSDNDGDDFVHPKLFTHDEETKAEESFDLIVQTPSHVENSDDEASHDTHVTLTTVNPDGQQQSSSVSSQFVSNMLNPSLDACIDSLFESTPRVDVSDTTTIESLLLTAPTLPPPSIPIISQTYFAVAADLSKLELNNILIEKMESNKSIHRSDEQRNLYKALVDAYECDKIILDTYGDTITLKRHRDDEDKDEESSAGLDRGSKRRRTGKELESTSAPKEKTSKTSGKPTEGSKSHQKTASESASAEEPMHTNLDEPSHQESKTSATDDQPIAEASQHRDWFATQAKPPTPDRD
nr:hypothetical protein [Tanacetum cinerariifolium]